MAKESKNNHALFLLGASIKYVTLEGEEVPECVTVCDRGGSVHEHVTSHLQKKFSYIRNMKFKVMFNFLW